MSLTKATYSMILGAPFNVLDYGADSTGATDSTVACQSAIDACVAAGGGTVYFPHGTYLLTGAAGADGIVHGIHVPFTGAGISAESTGIILQGDGAKTILKANSASMIVVRWSTNNSILRNITIEGNVTSSGLVLCSSNSTASTPSNGINYNSFSNLLIKGCGVDGIRLQCPLGADNGVYYNTFSDSYIFFAPTASGAVGGRGIYLFTYTGATGDQNRNSFNNIRFQRLNTGIEIQDGDTNTFYSCTFEDVSKGTFPNATPTAIKIGAGVVSSASNRFFGCTAEACTRDLENANAYSEFFSCLVGITGNMVLTANPMVWMGGYDGSNQPTLFPGWKRNAGSAGILVSGNTISDVNYLYEVGNGNFGTRTKVFIGNFAISGGVTKTLTCTFDTALATTAAIDVTVNVRFHGRFINWNASGQKLISTTFNVPDPKTTPSNIVDTVIIATTGIGGVGVVDRSALTFSTTGFTVGYLFTSATPLASPVDSDIEIIVSSSDTTNSRPVISVAWS